MAKLQLNLTGKLAKTLNQLIELEPTHASRYWILVNLLMSIDSKNLKILDVGGKKGLLHHFPEFHITIIDIEESDEPNFVQGDALNMPFKDNEFDYAVSCDVLEHISSANRERFINEMLRVSRKGIILAAPFSRPSVNRAEEDMNKYHEKLFNKPHRWLEEHIENGLPDENITDKIINKQGYHFAKFHHFSLETWRLIIKIHLLQSAYNDDKDLNKLVMDIYKKYYLEICKFDYTNEGYRTFYVVNKDGQVSVELPKKEDINIAISKFITESSVDIIDTLEAKVYLQRELSKKVDDLSIKNVELQAEAIKLNTELRKILHSKRWKAISKVAKGKSLLVKGK